MLYMCVQHAYVPLPSSHFISSSFISVLFMFWSEVVQPEEMEPLVQQHSTTKGNICRRSAQPHPPATAVQGLGQDTLNGDL